MSRKLTGLFLSVILASGAYGADQQPLAAESGIKVKVLHHFTGGADGCCLYGGLAKDAQNNLYGVTYSDDYLHGAGLLFKLTHTRGGYRFHVLAHFSREIGRQCVTTPTPDQWGNLFGVCPEGGSDDKGTFWEYSRSGQLTLLHSFAGPADGMGPRDSVAIDNSGNIYGIAGNWGPGGFGTLWHYSASSGVFTLLHSFSCDADGGVLGSGPRIDKKTGVVWGTTERGANCDYNGGTVWSYDPASGIFSTVSNFDSGLFSPLSRLIFDKDGNAFGTSQSGLCGAVYELPKDKSYIPVTLYDFSADYTGGCGVYGRVRFDDRGNLLGTTYGGGDFGCGTVYELVRDNDGWQPKILLSLNGNDGCDSNAGLKTDHHGHWFGTAVMGGKYTWGTVFEVSGLH